MKMQSLWLTMVCCLVFLAYPQSEALAEELYSFSNLNSCLAHCDQKFKAGGFVNDACKAQDCYTALAKKSKSAKECEPILKEGEGKQLLGGGNLYSGCIKDSGITDPMACDKLAGSMYQTLCAEDMAISSKSPEPCQRLKSEGAKGECVIKLVKRTKNTSFCNRLTDVRMHENCLRQANR